MLLQQYWKFILTLTEQQTQRQQTSHELAETSTGFIAQAKIKFWIGWCAGYLLHLPHELSLWPVWNLLQEHLGWTFPSKHWRKIPALARIDRLFTKSFFNSDGSHIYRRSQRRQQVTHWSLQKHSRLVLKRSAKENTSPSHLPLCHLDKSISRQY